MMKVHLVFPKLPPAFDAIGEHTALLASALASQAQVKVLTAQAEALPLDGIPCETCFSLSSRRGVLGILNALQEDTPDWAMLQYNPFSYGRWGINPYLAQVIKTAKERRPQLRFALLVHEVAPPWLNWRLAMMSTWQRWQLRQLGRLADLVVFTLAPWEARYGPWFSDTPTAHLPVGSNMPLVGVNKQEARRQLGLAPDALVLGYFGSAHHSRSLRTVHQAVAYMAAQHSRIQFLYVGPDGATVRRIFEGLPVQDAGRQPPARVSLYLSAMDVFLAPFRHGVSTRRGSFMAAIQHGLPVVSTRGWQTGPLLTDADGTAFVLVPEHEERHYAAAVGQLAKDESYRQALGTQASAFYAKHFAWEVLASQVLTLLNNTQEHGLSRAKP